MNIKLSPTARALLSLYIPSMIVGFGRGMAVPAIPILATHFGVSVGLAAQVVTAHMLGATLLMIPAGIMVDRLGRKPTMITGTVMIALGSLITAVSPSFSLMLVAQFITGAGGSLWQLAREVAAVDLVRGDQRGRLMSSFFGISNVGTALGPLLGGVIADLFGFRAVFLVYAGMALSVLLFTLTIRETGARRRAGRTPLFDFRNFKEIDPYFQVTYIILLFGTMAAMLRMSAMNSMLPLYAGAHLGFSATEVGSLFGVVGIVTLAMIAPAGFISDKLGRKYGTVPAAVLSAVAFLGYPFSHTLFQLSFFSGIAGVANGLALGAMSTSTYDIVPESGRGQLQALRRSVGEIGALTGPLVGGVVANTYNPGTSFLFFAPFHILSALLLAFVSKESLVRHRNSSKTSKNDAAGE